jgi:hypothetical protein
MRSSPFILACLSVLVSCREQPAPDPAGPRAGIRALHGLAAPPTHSSAQPPDSVAQRSNTTLLLRKEYRGVGTLFVTMQDSPALLSPGTRSIHYEFNLRPVGTIGRDIGDWWSDDPTPFGSGEPDYALRGAELTPDPVLVAVLTSRVNPHDGCPGYHGKLWPLPESELNVPGGAYQEVFYAPWDPEPIRKVTITGSIKQNNLTVSLSGLKDTLRFRFVLFRNDQVGWYRVPDTHPAPKVLYIAPDLNQANQNEGK